MFNKHDHEIKDSSETANPWSSYSDMMAALLLVFVLIMFHVVYQYLDTQETSTAQLNELIAETEFQHAQLLEQQARLAEQQQQMYEQEAQLAQQQERMAEQEVQLALQEQKIEQIIGVKTKIIVEIKALLDEAGLTVAIDEQTGAITLDSGIFFDTGSYSLKHAGKVYLDAFLPLYLQVLLDSENSEYISEIIIEGHTDTRNSYIYNLRLSQNRALAVAEYCMSNMQTLPEEYELALRSLLTANGRSYSRPILNEDGQVDMDASRRVEFKFRLKDFEMINDMQRILEGGDI